MHDSTAISWRPLIGITGRRWPVSRFTDLFPAAVHHTSVDLHFVDYPASVARAGGLPVELTRDAPVAEMVARLDGVVISGGADVDPELYGHEPHPELGAVERERDDWELAVIAEAVRQHVPVLGICRGAQLLAVHFGGTLGQHVGLDEGVGHPRFDEPGPLESHAVHLTAGTLAHRLYGDEVQVNSLHHQVIDSVPATVAVSGVAPDGVAESIEVPGCDVFGVQWHPEMLAEPDPSIRWLVDAARSAAGR